MNASWYLLADHLWQSTLFVGVVWVMTLALGKNRARVRHWLWLAASCKFLIPFSVLIALGSQIEWRKAPVPSRVYLVMDQVSQPFRAPVFEASAPPVSRNFFPEVLCGIWACGAIGIIAAWISRWGRVRAAVAAGFTVEMKLPIRVRCSPGLLEPGVFGIFRPVLLLPEGIFERLTPAQLEAVIEHELCHVRHRDNLIAAVHMFVEAVFWFHPVIWWIGKRMVEEREKACDEEVLTRGRESRVYAAAILEVCRLYVESPLECMAGVTGSDLKRRIEGIMAQRLTQNLSLARKVAMSLAGFSALAAPTIMGVLNKSALAGQFRAASLPKFEEASIRPGCGNAAVSGPGRMVVCVPLRTFIRDAYVVYNDGHHHPGYVNFGAVPIEGGPDWVRSDRYTINAKAEGSESFEMLRGPMMQGLLEDRFRLKIHRESRVGTAYTLVTGKGGARLQKSPEGSCVPFDSAGPPPEPGQVPCGPEPPRPASGSNFVTAMRGSTLDDFSAFLFTMLDRPVVNRTGITGRFDFRLEYTPDQNTPMILSWLAERRRPGVDPNRDPAAPPDPNGTPILNAIQEQLGLKLEPTKAPREFLVIDHVERPSEN